ncbi:MAG: RHS repeat-associated core domain-containing protein, partial [Clostridia bacterium]|nr:RHS repeat-associated core domain-containing protein [Clostridia bacterium]
APIAFDAVGAYSPVGTATQTLEGKNNKYTLTVSVDPEWMNSEERAYPITVDPALYYMLDPYGTAVQDTFIGDETVLGYLGYLAIDSTMAAYWRTSQLPELPEDAVNYGVKLCIDYNSSSGRFMPVLQLKEVTSDWSEATLTAANVSSVSVDSDVIAYTGIDQYFKYCWDITELAGKWYDDPTTNFGVQISRDMTADSLYHGVPGATVRLNSKESPAYTSTGAVCPALLTVSYTVNSGLEDYYTYSAQSAGFAGESYVHHAGGALTLAISTLTSTDSLMPVTPTLVYNSTEAGREHAYPALDVAYTESFMPLGFKLNISETILRKMYITSENEVDYQYIYNDADGTSHAFLPSPTEAGVYYDEDGLLMKLTVDVLTLTITDDSKLTRTFVKTELSDENDASIEGWVLSSIKDAAGNEVKIEFGEGYVPSMINLIPNGSQAITQLVLYYNSGKLVAVANHTSGEAVILRYSSTYDGEISADDPKYLREIRHVSYAGELTGTVIGYCYNGTSQDGLTVRATATYEYDAEGKITKVKNNLKGQSLVYNWNGKRVASVSEYAASALGQEISFTYGTGYTDVRSTGNDEVLNTADDILTRYVFDEHGRSVSTYSSSVDGKEIYGATVGKYEAQDNIKNNLKETTVLGGSSVNYLINGGFEAGFGGWTYGMAYTEYKSEYEPFDKYAVLSPAIGADAFISQYVSLDAGDYNLSFKRSDASSTVSGYVVIESIINGAQHTEEIPMDPNNIQANGTTVSVNFTVANVQNGGDKLKISIKFSTTSDEAFTNISIDNVMLTRVSDTSPFSHVDMGAFEPSNIDASGSLGVEALDVWESSGDENATVTSTYVVNDYVLRLDANSEISYVRQRVFEVKDEYITTMYPNVGATYIVSGFAKSVEAVGGNSSSFRLRVDISYYQGEDEADVIIPYYFDFLDTCEGWQFTGGSVDTEYIAAEGDENTYTHVRYIDLYCEYSGQPEGYALFDDISFVESTDGMQIDYYYYDNGLLAKQETLFHNEYYEYNDDRNITRFANSHGELTDYIYSDTNSNLLIRTEDYTFEFEGAGSYPFEYEDPDSLITKTPKTMTLYGYDSYGQNKSVRTYQATLDSDGETIAYVGEPHVCNYYIYETTSGSHIFGKMTMEWNGFDRKVMYKYDEDNGKLLAAVNPDTGTGLCYTYDDEGLLVGVLPVTCTVTGEYTPIENAEEVSYSYAQDNNLSKISTETTDYSFDYSLFDRVEGVFIGESEIVSYIYASNNGKLMRTEYANGFAQRFVYNDLELLSEVWYNEAGETESLAYSYEYTDKGILTKFVDHVNGEATAFCYDAQDRLVSTETYDLSDYDIIVESRNFYDVNGRLKKESYGASLGSEIASVWYSYKYLANGELTRRTYNGLWASGNTDFVYDKYNRLLSTSTTLKPLGVPVTMTANTAYTYRTYDVDMTEGVVTGMVNTIGDNTTAFTYEYDHNNNITRTVCNNAEVRYYYDDINQLVREDIGKLGKTYVYTYDNAGNMLSRVTYSLTSQDVTPTNVISTDTYAYGNPEWGDQLTAFNGTALTYDALGNPMSYYNGKSAYTFTWQGRRMVSATVGGNTYSFTYNDEGLRRTKSVNNATTNYYYVGSMLLAEETPDYLITYVYNENGLPMLMEYHGASYDYREWDVYFYEHNLQGDVVAMYDENGTRLISYIYDAWGNFTVEYHNGGASTSAVNNPYTYRSYYYDTDLGMYYVASRYYDANIRRFVSPDEVDTLTVTPMELTDKNLYAYCDNNPVIRVDKDGEFWHIITGAIVGAVVGAVSKIANNLKEGKSWCENVWISAAAGAATGAITAAGIPVGASVAACAAISATESVVTQGLEEGWENIDAVEVVIDTAKGTLDALGMSISKGNANHLMTQGVNATKNISKKGIGSSAKYYFKQTWKVFYNDRIYGAIDDILEAWTDCGLSLLINRWRGN